MLRHVADVAALRVATITAATLDARTSTSWITERDAVGYGVVVATDGWVLTTGDTVKSFTNVRTQADVWIEGVRYSVTQIVEDEMTDFVLLRIDASGLTPTAFGASASVRDGSIVYATRGTHGVDVTTVADSQAVSGVPVAAAELSTLLGIGTSDDGVRAGIFCGWRCACVYGRRNDVTRSYR